MIFIYQRIIEKYLKILKPEHIRYYAKENNIYVTDNEVLVIYYFIIENYNELLKDDKILEKLKGRISDDVYQKIVLLYKENKTKYLI